MKATVSLFILAGLSSLFLLTGCVSKAQYDQCVVRNERCNQRVNELLEEQQNWQVGAEEWQERFNNLQKLHQANLDKIEAYESQLNAKNALIERLSEMKSQAPALPPEVHNALLEWAAKAGSDYVTYDEEKGIVRFKSDLTFEKGDVAVQEEARGQLSELSKILNSTAAQDFDILIVGHTDDIPIEKPSTRAKHPTNLHLSAHRAISVQNIMVENGISPVRTAIMGFGEYRPIAPNKPNQGGNPKNRRVEIYIVPAGQIYPAGEK